MKIHRRSYLLIGSVLLAACLGDEQVTLFINFNTQPPDTTTLTSVQIGGEVVRSPAGDFIYTVTVTGGAEAVETVSNNFGLFSIDVPLILDSDNLLVLVARDPGGAESQAVEWLVTQEP